MSYKIFVLFIAICPLTCLGGVHKCTDSKGRITFSDVACITKNAVASGSNSVPKTQLTEQKSYHCDGRTRCSQMKSCEEATFFIKNCPDTKMDGDNDNIPCESQWCY